MSAAPRYVAMAPVLVPVTVVRKRQDGPMLRQTLWLNAWQILSIMPAPTGIPYAGATVRVQDGPSARDYYVEEAPDALGPYFGGLPAVTRVPDGPGTPAADTRAGVEASSEATP